MKWIFALLIIANAMYYLWSDEAPDTTTNYQQDSGVNVDAPTILLLEEARRQQLYPIIDPVQESAAPADIEAQEAPQRPQIAARPPFDPQPSSDANDRQATTAATSTATAPAAATTNPDPAPATAQPQSPTQDPVQDPIPTPPKDDPTKTSAASAPPAAKATTETAATTSTPDAQNKPASAAEASPEPPPEPPAPTATSTQPPPDTAKCFRVGPFDKLSSATSAKRQAIKLGFSGRLLQTVTRSKAAYLIYLGPYDDADDRLRTMNALFDSGIGDILIGTGEHINSVIAGSFPSRQAASGKIAELEQLGYKPQLSKHIEAKNRFYLHLNTPDSSGSPSFAETLQQQFPDKELKNTPCRTEKR